MEKHHVGLHIEQNAFVDTGDGTIEFPNGLPITDGSVQKNGTRYDIESLDLSEYNGNVTVDHYGTIDSIIGKALGVAKSGTQVVLRAIQFATKESATARLAYDLIKGGFASDFSIETYGPPADEEGVYKDAKLVGLSAVVVGNNNNAKINELALNSIAQAKQDGLDTSEAERMFNSTKVEVAPSENGKPTEIIVTVRHESTKQENNAVAVEEEPNKPNLPEAPPDPQEDEDEAVSKSEFQSFTDEIKNLFKDTVKPLQEKITAFEQNAFDKSAKEPEFQKVDKSGVPNVKSELAAMGWEDRTAAQVNAAWDLQKGVNPDAAIKLRSINEFHLADLKKEGLAKNAVTLGDFGNFVVAREMLTQIYGARNNYSALVSATNWRETLSTQMAWLNRSGDIDMQSVEFCDDGANGNLKPISEYSATIRTADLEELAAVTPVCNAATRFLAADLLADVAQGYRTDYDRKRAQLVIARLEQAVEANPANSVVYDTSSNVNALINLLDAWEAIAQATPNGTFIFNTSTYAQILGRALSAGVSGPLSQLFTTGDQPRLFGRPYIIVPNDLLPTLNTAGTKAFAVNDVTVTVNHAVFYVDLSNFTGRTSGGLQYDLSTDAAYEEGGTVKSAYQRNELVLRGSFFRGGAVLDNSQVAAVRSPGVS